MRIFIIGGTGDVGRRVVRALVGEGHQVTLFHRGKTAVTLPSGVKALIGERSQLRTLAASVEADVIADFVCATEYDARGLVTTFSDRANRSVVLSSADVYRAYEVLTKRVEAPIQPTPLSEDAELRSTRYPYRASSRPLYWAYDKLLVEQAVSEPRNFPVTILRLPVVYGVRGMVPYLDYHIDRMLKRSQTIAFDAAAVDWKGCWGHIENVVSAIVLAITDSRAAGQVYNLADEGSLTYRELLEVLRAVAGHKGELLPIKRESLPLELLVAPNPQQCWDLDTAHFRTDLGFRDPISRVEALADFVGLTKQAAFVC